MIYKKTSQNLKGIGTHEKPIKRNIKRSFYLIFGVYLLKLFKLFYPIMKGFKMDYEKIYQPIFYKKPWYRKLYEKLGLICLYAFMVFMTFSLSYMLYLCFKIN